MKLRYREPGPQRKKPVAGDTVQDVEGTQYTVTSVGLKWGHVVPLDKPNAHPMLLKIEEMLSVVEEEE